MGAGKGDPKLYSSTSPQLVPRFGTPWDELRGTTISAERSWLIDSLGTWDKHSTAGPILETLSGSTGLVSVSGAEGRGGVGGDGGSGVEADNVSGGDDFKAPRIQGRYPAWEPYNDNV